MVAYPGEITRIKARFRSPGLYVWHCHILEHEDNEMMRPFEVVAPLIDLSFSDVPPTDENYTAIQWLARREMVPGRDDGTFGPADPVLRAQLAKMVVIGFEAHNEATTNLGHQTFGDVAYTGEPYPFDYIEEANEAAFMTGYHGGGFGPYDALTRIQLVRVMVRAAGDALAASAGGVHVGLRRRDRGRRGPRRDGEVQRTSQRQERRGVRPLRDGHPRPDVQGPLGGAHQVGPRTCKMQCIT